MLPTPPLKRRRLESVMARYSENSIAQMQNCERDQKIEKQRTGAQKRAFALALAPARHCFRALDAPNKDDGGQAVTFTVAKIPELLQYIASKCPDVRADLERASSPIQVVLSWDETTAGNVLATAARMKATIFYITFKHWQRVHESQHAWIPVGAISHEQAEQIPGGMSLVHKLFLENWLEQRLDQGIWLSPTTKIYLQLTLFVADADAQRAALAGKGSAGLKCCAFCRNCLAKNSTGAAVDTTNFRTIAEANVNWFTPNTQEQLQKYIRKALIRWPEMTKKDKDIIERCLGFNVSPNTVWTSDMCCTALPLSRYMNDSMHCYFANGIAAVEINLLVQEVTRSTGKTIGDIKQAVLQAGWKRPGQLLREGQTKCWTGRLFVASFFLGQIYKGSAKQTRALLPLLLWLAESVWSKIESLRPMVDSFMKLCQCVKCLQKIASSHDWDELERVQEAHQLAFSRTYPEEMRPKHHHRLHLPQQYRAADFVATCWGTESKHRCYKSIYARNLQQFLTERNGGVEFSERLLPRLLLRSAELCKNMTLQPRTFQLEKLFDEAEVNRLAAGLEGCRVGARCRTALLQLQEGDLLLHGKKNTEAGVCHFFIDQANELFIYATVYSLVQHTAAMRRFERTTNKKMLKWTNLVTPAVCSWWRSTNQNDIFCMP